jgi:hypothetical protein
LAIYCEIKERGLVSIGIFLKATPGENIPSNVNITVTFDGSTPQKFWAVKTSNGSLQLKTKVEILLNTVDS